MAAAAAGRPLPGDLRGGRAVADRAGVEAVLAARRAVHGDLRLMCPASPGACKPPPTRRWVRAAAADPELSIDGNSVGLGHCHLPDSLRFGSLPSAGGEV